MHEYDMNTVNVPINEYLELKQKAEMNGLLIQQFGKLEEKVYDLDRRIYELEWKLKGGESDGI